MAASRPAAAQVINSEWNASGVGDWNVPANWLPNDVPDNGGGLTYNVRIGNRPVAVGATVLFRPKDGTSDTIATLTVSGGAELNTRQSQLNVLSLTTIETGSSLWVDPHNTAGTASLLSPTIQINEGAVGLRLHGGIVSATRRVNNNGTVYGFGTINAGDSDAVAERAFDNSGIISLRAPTLGPGTLILRAVGADTIDLDGTSESGSVDLSWVYDSLTLIVDGPLSDAFGGGTTPCSLDVGAGHTVTFNDNFGIAANASVLMGISGGIASGGVTTLNGAGSIAPVSGATFTIFGQAVIENDLTFTGTSNVVSVHPEASLALNGSVGMDASALRLAGSSALFVGGELGIGGATRDFDWDGGEETATTTIRGTGSLTIGVDQIEATGIDAFDGTLNLQETAALTVYVSDDAWEMSGSLNKTGAGTAGIFGDAINVSGNLAVETGTLNLPETWLTDGATVTSSGLLTLGDDSLLAGFGLLITGTGTLRIGGTSAVAKSATVSVNTFDWDGTGAGTMHTIRNGATLTINSPVFDTDGDMDDPLTFADYGTLIVNGPAQWTMNGAIIANAAALGAARIGGTSRMILAGSIHVQGDTQIEAPVTFAAGSTANIDAGRTLFNTGNVVFSGLTVSGGGRFSTARVDMAAGTVTVLTTSPNGGLVFLGGSLDDPNTLAGGTLNGTGRIAAPAGRALQGFGTINAQIDFDDTAELIADGGLLNVNGTIVDVGTIRIGNAPAVLNLASQLSMQVTDGGIVLKGGTLQGATVATASASQSIRGRGMVASAVTNTGALIADGGALVFGNAGSDWDGTANAGQLRAVNVGRLELKDNATFGFGGSLSADDRSHVFTNGFSFHFNPGSAISLTGGIYESTHTTGIGGTVTVNAGGDSTIEVSANRLLGFEATSVVTLNGNLRLANNNIGIASGAVFNGAGALIIPANSLLGTDASANINVLLDNQGTFHPAGTEAVGGVTLRNYRQSDTGRLFVEITGTGVNQFDRMAITGTAALQGCLELDIDGGFVPVSSQSFEIITASAGVSGRFDPVRYSGMPAGVGFEVAYLPNSVRVNVVPKPAYDQWIDAKALDAAGLAIGISDLAKSADFDRDGLTHIGEFALDGHPFRGSVPNKIFPKAAAVSGASVFTLTIPVRSGALPDPADPAGGPLVLQQTADKLNYSIQASDTFGAWTLDVSEVTGAAATAIQNGLPAPSSGWIYRTFRSPGAVTADPREFMRVFVTE